MAFEHIFSHVMDAATGIVGLCVVLVILFTPTSSGTRRWQ